MNGFVVKVKFSSEIV